MTNNLLIQVFSDIHIELWNKFPKLPCESKYLILAGDICKLNHLLFESFLDYCSEKWEKIFYIPGNHEFYSEKYTIEELEEQYKNIIGEKYKNIYYLNNSFVELDNNINIYGSIFWTIPNFKTDYQAKLHINDYNFIKNLHIEDVTNLANESYDKLNRYLSATTKKTIIVTHFPPIRTGTSDPKYLSQDKTITEYFSWPDNTLENINNENIIAWISGHTHWSYDFEQNSIRLIGNQLGYKSEIGKTGLKQDGLYELIIS